MKEEDDFVPIARTLNPKDSTYAPMGEPRGRSIDGELPPDATTKREEPSSSDYSPIAKSLKAEPSKAPAKIPFIDPAELKTMGALGAGAGMIAGGVEKGMSAAPNISGSAGERWARKVLGLPYSESASGVTEQAQAYQRAKGQSPVLKKFYSMVPPAAPGEPAAAFERMIARNRAAEEAAKAANYQKISQGLGRIPLGSTAMGGLGGMQLAQAAKAYKEGDIPQAAISGAGGAGALASLIPNAPRIIGGTAAIASLPAQFVYEAIKGLMKEREQNVGPKMGYFQRLRELPEVSEEEIRMSQAAGPALSRANLGVPEPIRFAGGLPRTQQ